MIRVENLKRSFNDHDVLKGVSLEVKEGEALALIGRSGYGKSVLLRHIMGLTKPDEGHVYIAGQDIHRAGASRKNKIKEKFGVLFQGGALFDSMTVFENVAFPLVEKFKMDRSEVRDRVIRELEQVELADAVKKYPAEISGGMQKRVALARAIIHNPEIVFFDEPTTGLDPVTARSMHKLIDRARKRLQFTAIIVTHEVPAIFPLVDKVAMLHDGVIVASGSPDEIVKADHYMIKEFFGINHDEQAV